MTSNFFIFSKKSQGKAVKVVTLSPKYGLFKLEILFESRKGERWESRRDSKEPQQSKKQAGKEL